MQGTTKSSPPLVIGTDLIYDDYSVALQFSGDNRVVVCSLMGVTDGLQIINTCRFQHLKDDKTAMF